MKALKHTAFKLMLFTLPLLQSSCKKFLEIDVPKSSIAEKSVFANNDVATSAVTGIYSQMASTGYAAGGSSSITFVAGLSADEFIAYKPEAIAFNENNLSSLNSIVTSGLYSIPYLHIYTANAVLEGLEAENGVTPPVHNQLRGEALFIRSFIYFNLINLFGDVPLNLTTDYRVNQNAIRTPVNQIYSQLIKDLSEAEGLLNDQYITTERIRPNKAAVQALLARVFLYQKDWENAEAYATKVIEKTGTYSLTALNEIFLKNSPEAIWQLMPPANTNAQEGSFFILNSIPLDVSVSADFLKEFEHNDERKTAWINAYTDKSSIYYYPFKYKIKTASSPSEYSMVLRLAEQFLIRAEARAMRHNMNGAIDDLDKIRNRAGLGLIKDIQPNISEAELLNKIQKERQLELFAEWGHRWFDLKRTGTADQVLSLLKPDWKSTDQYYPIPQNELNRNQKIIQNEGY